MDYSPKLKTAISEIKAVLEKHRITGIVIIHTPGFSEYLNHLTAPYSAIKLDPTGNLRLQLKAKDLPGGEKEAHLLAHDTYNMITHLSDNLQSQAFMYLALKAKLQAQWNGEDGDSHHSSNTQQNN